MHRTEGVMNSTQKCDELKGVLHLFWIYRGDPQRSWQKGPHHHLEFVAPIKTLLYNLC